MDGLGQTGSDRSGDQAENGSINGHSAPWASQAWSSAGAALEPSLEDLTAEPLAAWNSAAFEAAADRRGIEALAGGDVDDSMTSTLVQPRFTPFSSAAPFRLPEEPSHNERDEHDERDSRPAAEMLERPPGFRPFTDAYVPKPNHDAYSPAPNAPNGNHDDAYAPNPHLAAEDPYADELAQRSAEFARHAAFDDATPPQGLPLIDAPPPVSWATPTPGPSPVIESPDIGDPPLAAQLTLGQRFGMAFNDEDETESEDEAEAEARLAEDLPRRDPAEPDVPDLHETTDDDNDSDPLEDKAQLTRIASHLRREDVPEERPDGFDVQAVLAAVRAVAGVREATVRTTPTGGHHLRLELAEGADASIISRMVARMLQEQMGIDAALTGTPGTPPAIPNQQHEEPTGPSPVVLPGPRSGLGAALPPAVENWTEPVPLHPRPAPESTREPRRRHPVSVPRRQPSELRPSERAAATWKSATESDQALGSTPPPLPTDREQGPRPIIEHVQTSTFGLDATVEVRLNSGDRQATGVASGPAVDAYVLRLSAAATAAAIDDLLKDGTSTGETSRCFVEHAAIVPMGSCDVAVVVVLLVCGGWVEQLAGSALVSGDPRRAVVRATLGAVNRRLAALLP